MQPNILICLALVNSAIKVVTNGCPDFLVEYQSRCFAECPEETKLIAGSNNCTEACPEFAPFTFEQTRTCTDHCPFSYSISSDSRKTCVKTKQPDKNLESSATFYRGCPSSFHCDSVRPFCYKLQCFEHCPLGTKILNLQCVNVCPDNKPYTLNQTCKTSCPLTHRFMTNEICSSSCAEGLKTYGTRCVVDCPKGTFSLKSQCVPRCPHTSPFILTIENASSCHEQCPANTAVNASKCEISCPAEEPYLFNRTCVASCPVDHPFLMNKQLEYNSLALCLRSCPEDRVIDGVSCVRKCTSDMVLFNKTCVRNCPSSKPLVNLNFECVEQCSNSEYAYQSKCFRKCPSNSKTLGSRCVEDCRNTAKPFTLSSFLGTHVQCVSKCPEFYRFSDNFTCVFMCPSLRTYTFNNTCYEACVDSHRYYRPLIYSETYNYTQYICLKNCTQEEYVYQNKCVDHCPTDYKYVLNKTCHDVCPVSHSFRKSVTGGIKCLTTCDKFTFINSSFCLDTCPKGTFHYNKTCVYQCPDELAFNTMNKTCVPFCQLYLNKTCMQNCPPGLCEYNRSCIPANDTNLIYSIKDEEGKDVSVCVNSCPSKTVKFGFSCVVSCPKSYVYFNGLCLKKCPSTHPYKDVSSQRSTVCVKGCPKGTVNYDDQCRKSCPFHRPLNSNNICVKQCPNRLRYHENSICKSKCDNDKYVNGNECVTYCPYDRDLVANKVCYSECPPEYPYKVYQECLSVCEGDRVLERNASISKCITSSECQYKKKVVLDNQFCVEHCPDNAVFDTAHGVCSSFSYTERSISLAVIICLPFIAIIGCVFCHGNFKIRGRICSKRNYKPLSIDEDETCVMEIYSENGTNIDTTKEEGEHSGNNELQIDEPIVLLTEDISMEEA